MSTVWGQRRPQMGLPPVMEDQQLSLMCEWIDTQFMNSRRKSTDTRTFGMESEAHLWEYVYTVATEEPTVLVCLNGERQRSAGSLQEADRLHRVDRRWFIVLLRGHGLNNLMPQASGNPARQETLMSSVAALRDTVRALANVSEEWPLHYEGWAPLRPVARPGPANVFLTGAELTFSSCNDLGEARGTAI